MEMEWKSVAEIPDVSGYDFLKGSGNYEVSSLGEIRIKTSGFKDFYSPKSQKTDCEGYKYVAIGKNTAPMHRLVAFLFKYKEYEKVKKEAEKNGDNSTMEVHHENRNREDNNIDNLTWVTQKQHSEIHNVN